MLHHSFLYKDLSPDLADMPYKQALLHKIEEAVKLSKELLEVHYTIRDTVRIREINKAISFNKNLLTELTEMKG